jgi:hypothetical protein
MASTLSSFDAFLENYYSKTKVENLTMAGKPMFQRIKKNEAVGGRTWNVALQFANPQGLAAQSVAVAQTAAAGAGGNVQGVQWAIQMGDYSGSVSIGDKVLMASRNNIAAFLEDQTTEIDGLYEGMANCLSLYLWRNGGGSTGVIGSGGTTATLVLATPSDAFNFEVGEFVVASANDGSASGNVLLAGSTFITAIDRTTGTITLNAAQGAWVNGSFLFRSGDFAGNITQVSVMKGVDAYITASTSPGVLYGVARTTDVQRLSGCKMAAADIAGKGIEERIQQLGAFMAGRYRAMTAAGSYECYLHPEDWQNLSISLQSRGIRSLTDSSTSFNFEFIEVLAGGKRLKVFADPYVVKGTAYILRMENWILGSYGELIRTLNGDGLTMLRAVSSNDYEYRLQAYPAVACTAPGFNGRVALP